MPDRKPDPTKNPPPEPAPSPEPEPIPDPAPDTAPESPLKARIKSMFETPQKARITITCLVVGLITFACVIVYIIYVFQNYYSADVPPSSSPNVSDAPVQSGEPGESDAPDESPDPSHMAGLIPTLTIDQARVLALEEAGVTENEVEVTREALTEDNGIWVYEFRFHTETVRYEYLINANTGAVRSMLKETIVYPSPEVTEPPAPVETDPAETERQPSDSADPQPTPSDPPADSQPPATPEPTPSPSPSPTPAPSQSTMYIGMERAKTAALDHAGLSASQVAFTRLRMSRVDGRMVYQIEFRQGDVRYAYQIDASTGRVLEHGVT